MQIVVHNRNLDIEQYINWVNKTTAAETNELIRVQAEEYAEFIKSFVDLYHIIAKRFYVVVPYQNISLTDVKPKTETPIEEFSVQKSQLKTRTEEIANSLEKIGLKTAILETEDLIELFYNLYNPSLSGERKFTYNE